MKKKLLFFCFLAVMTLLALPVTSIAAPYHELQPLFQSTTQPPNDDGQGTLDSPWFTGYLLIRVLTYSPGEGIHPYERANITVRGLFYSYNGQTDETGDCLFKLHTNLFRPKKYFVRVSIPPDDWFHTKRVTFFIEPRQIIYREFLFVVL